MNLSFGSHSPRRLRRLAVACLATAAIVPGRAQSSGPESPPETVLLNPFVVSTAKDSGYMATSTLSGTRTSTDLKDIGNPIDIFTAELMQDLAIQDIQDLTNFATGVNPNAAGALNPVGEEREVWNYNYMEIRGFKTGVVTRNFMDLNAQFESYNSERVEFSKGPNAILSGTGNPGGTVNFSTKVPLLRRNAYSVEHRTDDLGSQRVSIDANHVLRKDVLGLRLNALWQDQDYYRQPAYLRQKAWHLTSQWRPTPNTTITVGYEDRDSERASPRGIFPRDRVTAWLNAGSPIVTAVPSNNNVIVAGTPGTQSAASLGMATTNGDLWILDSDGVVRNVRGTARGNIINANTNNMDTVSTGFPYPLDKWIGGPNGINDSRWRITEINLSQRVGEGFFVDLAFGRALNDVVQGNSVSRDLFVDTNSFGVNQRPGQLYAETQPFRIVRGFETDHYRATASYDLKLHELNRWLGAHRVAVAYENNSRDEWWNHGRLTLTGTPSGPVNPGAFNGGFTNSALNFFLRDYLDLSSGNTSQRDLRDVYYSDGISQGGYTAEYKAAFPWAVQNLLNEQDTVLGVLQSRWLEGRLITTVGLRKDKRYRTVAPFVQNPATGEYVPKQLVAGAPAGSTDARHAAFIDPPKLDEGISRNYGAVLHATPWLSFTFNFASNLSNTPESLGLLGDFVPASTGESKDYGIRLNLLNDRLNISLLKFETSELKGIVNGGSINSPYTRLVDIETILVDNGILAASPLRGVHTTADRAAEGEELTIIGNPTPKWTFRLSASRLINEQRNLAPEVRAYYAANMPFYKAQNPALTRPGSDVTLGTRILEAETQLALMDTRENVRVFPASEYTVRLTGKYTFDRDTPLRGLSIGGTTRWKSAPIIGYYRNSNPVSFDANRPFRGKEEFISDLFVTYQRRLSPKLHWRVQLNVSNVFDQNDPWPVSSINSVDAADFTVVPYLYRPIDGRVFTLTNTLSF